MSLVSLSGGLFDFILSCSLEFKYLFHIFLFQNTVSELISFLTVPNLDIRALKTLASMQLQELAKAGKAGLLHAIENHKV